VGAAEDMENIRAGVEAFNRGDLEAINAGNADDVEFLTAITSVEGGGVYRGHDGVRKWVSDLGESVEGLKGELDELHEVSADLYLGAGRFRGRGRESGAEFDMKMAWVYRFRNGLQTRYEAYFDRAEALKAVGLEQWPDN
jgi:ketosteroid isomerase-like protein